MNIYIAAPWAHRAQMPAIATKFEDAGHEITHKWWEVEDVPEDTRSEEALRDQAILDVEGVLNGEVMVLINSAKSEGKALEQGIAIASGKEIYAVGQRGEHSKNVFHYLDNYTWFNTVEDVIEVMETL